MREIKYACQAMTEQGARCRYFVTLPLELPENVFCSLHEEKAKEGKVTVAPPPDVILFKFRVNPNWYERLLRSGIELRRISPQGKREMKHIMHAKKYRRAPYRFRGMADSGTPVFGKEGLPNVGLSQVWSEILSSGYGVKEIFLSPRAGEPMATLTVVLQQKGGFFGPRINRRELYRFMFATSFGFAHVWANPPQENGLIVHTVNLVQRIPQKEPSVFLTFNKGLWGMKINE